MPELNENPRARPPDPYEGRVIDKYTLIGKLGTGGMGLVYRAAQQGINRQVAVKLLSSKLIHDQVNVQRLVREAEAMGNLRHPNIAAVHDFDICDGQPYLVMELIAGRSLGDILDEQNRIEPERVISIAAQVADAMAYAHKQGLVHRDLKPDNIMLDNEHTNDFVKVLDFGIAKAAAEDLSLTKSGVLIGSPLYMSPEQCRGAKLDARSDIYSLGVIIYEALTGLVPCKGDTLIETLSRKTMEQAPPFPPEFSEWKDLEQLTLDCLATEPEDRPESMAVVRDELLGILNPGAVSRSMSSLRNPRSSGTNSSMATTAQGQSQGRQSPKQFGGSTQGQSRTGSRRSGRTTQSQSRSNSGSLAQNQTVSQLQGYEPVLDETGQIYKPLISSKQMIILGTTVGVIYLMSVTAGFAWVVGIDQGNGPKSLWASLSGSQSSSGTSAQTGNDSQSESATGSSAGTDNAGRTSGQDAGTTSGAGGLDWRRSNSAQNRSAVTKTPSRTVPPTATKIDIKPVRTAKVKTKPPKVSHSDETVAPAYSYRYGSRGTNQYSSPPSPRRNIPDYGSTQYTSVSAGNTGDVANSPRFQSGRNVRFDRRTVQIEADRQVQEHLKAQLQAAAEERAAAAAAVNARRMNDLDAVRRQYGGGQQWGKDTGSSYYGNGQF